VIRTSISRRRLRTARRFVFENIMDLDHVCPLHRRWFADRDVRVNGSMEGLDGTLSLVERVYRLNQEGFRSFAVAP
jgi:hypothetical protein